MNGVAQKMGDAVNGVPYLIIGKKTFNGYSESDNEVILKAILVIALALLQRIVMVNTALTTL